MSCDFIAQANLGVQGLHPYQPGKPIEELQRELGVEHVVKLASNENPLGPSPKVVAACSAAAQDICRYPDASGFELKKALSAYLSVDAELFTLGNGSNDVLDLIARTFLQPGTSAVYSQHGFIVYPIAVKACGARAIVTPAKQWGHDLTAMAAAVEVDTKVIFIANPNNPTGTSFARAEFTDFMAQVPAHVVVVLDEAYVEFNDGEDQLDGVTLLPQYDNLIVTRTFSKAWGLAALRVGYAVAGQQITDLLNRVRAPFNVNSMALVAAEAVLADADYLAQSRAVNHDGMQQLTTGLEKLGVTFIPSAGNFIAAEFRGDVMAIYQKLLEQGVIVRPVGVYEMPQHLRISVGLESENTLLLQALAKVLGEQV
ncbi:Histidinol-phosphate aminotransferase [Sinobacterium norvegicum]|uniref:Histidinol-phosphate aminotransferase n=1 Tax=Sinobacterium norvegicum TaxID=1641715 RepID=A0ABM9ADI0_9GAMM|nr:histidinol-phosphate transaminase [Sinobacterium norvegicum]CAH0990759.1 Histidinol-phosphate aminotransferase [Sinobacterium norvegicum]